MTLARGRAFLSIPGPTNVPDAVLQAMQRPAIDIYSGSMLALTESCLADLPRIFRTRGSAYVYAANGHGGWEAGFTNVLSRGDRVLVLESGLFAGGWGAMAAFAGVEIETLAGDFRRAVDPAAVAARLARDRERRIKAVMVVQIDTASGVVNDLPAIRRALDAVAHPALLMVDCVASLGCMPFQMDAWGIDVAVCGSQKGLMAPPGLAFVAASPRARAAHQGADLRTQYWDWTFRDGSEHYRKYCGTAPEHLMFALRQALDLLLEEGLENAFRRHALLAEATRRAVARWAGGGALAFNVTHPEERSNSVTAVLLPGRDPQPLMDYTRDVCGVTLGTGIGPLRDRGFRIAHMGHVNAPMVLGTLGAVEMGLKALDIPHGSDGLGAAIDYLARETRRPAPAS
jgi:alanine-glyoxylate transaminase/serine-glyoxylate transaminase/serine-pyruvate transaminase